MIWWCRCRDFPKLALGGVNGGLPRNNLNQNMEQKAITYIEISILLMKLNFRKRLTYKLQNLLEKHLEKRYQNEPYEKSTGSSNQDELFAFGIQCQQEYLSHSFTFDHKDSYYTKYEVSTPTELEGIKSFEEKKLPIMPTKRRDFIKSFNKNSSSDLRNRILQFQVFNGEEEIEVSRGETSSSSSNKRKSKGRSVAGLEPLERKKIGSKCGMIFTKQSCGHDEVEEYGASEAGKDYDRDQATKRLEESFVKLRKCLKDMLDNILFRNDDYKKLQTVGFIHSGLQSYVVRADRPTRYITRTQKYKTYHVSNNISNFGSTILPVIYIAWVIKDIAKNTYNIIQESDEDDNNSNSSEWLTQYWDESEEEDMPQTSSSQEKVVKKNKT
ncbi:hypothetical protein INT48_001824 [Thamnidium elegans]|uniref:Uncharacterized protein n=1 Tax=Thamnidium elegans TaxID=101142 RepID=A0A8H7SXW8_9FUNG|nr:hypothetical protein INT48_001824 [Thamnidium elegans]